VELALDAFSFLAHLSQRVVRYCRQLAFLCVVRVVDGEIVRKLLHFNPFYDNLANRNHTW